MDSKTVPKRSARIGLWWRGKGGRRVISAIKLLSVTAVVLGILVGANWVWQGCQAQSAREAAAVSRVKQELVAMGWQPTGSYAYVTEDGQEIAKGDVAFGYCPPLRIWAPIDNPRAAFLQLVTSGGKEAKVPIAEVDYQRLQANAKLYGLQGCTLSTS